MTYKPPAVLPKTEYQRVKELKQMLVEGKGQHVVQKVIDIALDDSHPSQMAALKMCMDRALPMSVFEKTSAQRNAVTINITGLGQVQPPPEIIEAEPNDE
jgi:hypothetical protein